MAGASITFTDGIGSATLTNIAAGTVGSRFWNWEPRHDPIKDEAVAQGNAAISAWVFRDDYIVDFQLPHISSIESGGVAMTDIAARLIAWLLIGGQCSVTTGDADSNVYPTCGLNPGTKPTLKLTDSPVIEYTLTLSLVNLAANPAPLLCRYANQ